MNKTQYVIYLYRELSSRHRGRISVASSIALVFLFLTWGLNFTVCFCVIKNRKLHKLTNFFLVILAFADLTWEVTVMPLWIDVLINGKMRFSQTGCMFTGFMTTLCKIGKLMTIYMISINRLCNVYWPSIYPSLYNKCASIAMVTITWCVSLIIAIVVTTVSDATFEFHPGRGMCLFTYKDLTIAGYLTISKFLFSAVIPLCINTVCHFKAYNELKEHKRETRGKVRIQIFAVPEMIKEEVEQTTSKDEIQATRTLLGIVYVYCLCSILTTSIEMADAYRPYFLDRGTHLALTFFGFVNSILNPLMLTRTNKEFRDVVVVMVGCKWNSRAIHVQ
ncbi:melatonin receptor type 1B-A [Exaiptasia diaphana]|uniref:G-protein coupled receptors family 1 profile domain-containing protein n=1 Tax=Exaiptasia diaphana TaxID=2652724 RepID=A0A913XXW8_EXADI|nr:melatonin receptor type 1B-A [Exaiptasia diaphana]XP_020911630.1 melatonin receptor type 1B-A [Exaiptasia diaphana]XP_028518103.1 melatonin receptor type 1B-A [Exaiptasia diaphana]